MCWPLRFCAGCRRLTPNFKIRAEVGFNTRCSFPLTLKVYVITQQEKDSVPEWVPDDFLDPDLPQVCNGRGQTSVTLCIQMLPV